MTDGYGDRVRVRPRPSTRASFVGVRDARRLEVTGYDSERRRSGWPFEGSGVRTTDDDDARSATTRDECVVTTRREHTHTTN